MKIAITAIENSWESQVDSRFGRAAGFIIFDSESGEYKFIKNIQNLNATQGAGIQTAQNIINNGVEVLITGHVGPKAFRVLNSSNITIYYCETITLKEALNAYEENRLQIASKPDKEGHW